MPVNAKGLDISRGFYHVSNKLLLCKEQNWT